MRSITTTGTTNQPITTGTVHQHHNHHNNNNNNTKSSKNVNNKGGGAMIALPKGPNHNNSDNSMTEVAGAQDTIYLCNFRVSVDGEWLCLKELQDLDMKENNGANNDDSGTIINFGIEHEKCELKIERDWVNYCRCLFFC